jgi:putative Mg2+ transporter-C (MgtC) family protein
MPSASLQGALDPAVWPVALDVLLKCGLSALLAGLIGYERELHGRPAGIRTHILLAV